MQWIFFLIFIFLILFLFSLLLLLWILIFFLSIVGFYCFVLMIVKMATGWWDFRIYLYFCFSKWVVIIESNWSAILLKIFFKFMEFLINPWRFIFSYYNYTRQIIHIWNYFKFSNKKSKQARTWRTFLNSFNASNFLFILKFQNIFNLF